MVLVVKNGLKYEIIRIWQRKKNEDKGGRKSETGNRKLEKGERRKESGINPKSRGESKPLSG
jgi:hypothetical protein